jgi:hypothetical protein
VYFAISILCSYASSVVHLKRRAVLRARLAVIVDAGGGDIRMPQPLLDFGDIGLVIKRIGGSCCPQRMGADLKSSCAE